MALLPGVAKRARARVGIDGGYRLDFDASSEVLRAIVEMIDAERQCCRFLRFRLTVEPDEDSILLDVTGPTGRSGDVLARARIATDGSKDMAERGLTSTLSAEINGAVAAKTAEHVFTGGNIADSPGSATAEFAISRDYPLVTLVSMIAPSPDWFVGVTAAPLLQDGQWTGSRRLDLDPWDAGTDGGATFTSPDLPLALRLPMARIVTAPLSPAGRVTSLGTFTFVRVQ